MSYSIKDEEGYKVRVVGRLEEAKAICAVREGWTYKFIHKPKETVDLTKFEEALI